MKQGVFDCPYRVKSGSYKEHVRSNNEVKVLGKPEFIADPDTIVIKKSFNETEFEKKLYQLSTDKGWDTKEFDVDGDTVKYSIKLCIVGK